MTTLGDVGEGLDKVLDKAAQAGAALHTAAELAEGAQQLIMSASEGSSRADVETTNVQFAAVVNGTKELHKTLGIGISGVEAILHALRLGRIAARSVPELQRSERDGRERIERLRQGLPPPVRRGTGQKTHGRWLTPGTREGDEEAMTSGRDRLSVLAEDRLRELGARRAPVTTADVEIKLAVHMVEAGIAEATLVINNAVCKGPYGCDTLVPMLLPENSVLTVHEVTDAGVTTKTYRGGMKPTWR